MGDAAIVNRLHHVGDAREFVSHPRGQLQTERGHRVVSTGPYAWCGIPCTAASSCFSWARRCCWLVVGGGDVALFIVLFASAPRSRNAVARRPAGYADYTARVRYRLVPGLLVRPILPTTAFFTERKRSDARTQNYTGGCHCGMVRFECTADLAVVTACNCSICTKKCLHFTFVAPKSFQLRAARIISGNICSTARDLPSALHRLRRRRVRTRQQADGTEVVALNVSCIDGIELAN